MPAKASCLRIPVPKPPSYDTDETNRLMDEAFDGQGWLTVDEDGVPTYEWDKLRHAIFMAFTTKHVVTSTAASSGRREFADLVQDATVTRYGLYGELFPSGPASKAPPRTREEQEAKDHIANYIWKQCNPASRAAWLQKELADSGLVVLETTKFPKDPTLQPEPGRYVTNVESAMMDFLEHKVFEDIRKRMSEVDQWLATFMARNPDIALPAARKAKQAIKAAVDSAVHADPKYVIQSLAITSGSDDDTTSEE